MTSLGTGIAFLGAILAVGLACAGSGRGVGLAGEAGAGVIAEDPSKFAQCLILEIIPGTQGLYGLVIWFFAMMKMGFFATGVPDLSLSGIAVFCCVPAYGYRRVFYGHCPGALCRGWRNGSGPAGRSDGQGPDFCHHGGVLCDFMFAGVFPDVEQFVR